MKIRSLHPKDHAYIYDSWYKNSLDNSPKLRNVPVPVVSATLPRIINHHLTHSQFAILSGDEYKDWMAGYVCGMHTELSPIVHYVYVRRSFRGKGVGKQLLKAFLDLEENTTPYVYYSNETGISRDWRRNHLCGERKDAYYLDKRWLYNPWLETLGMEPGWQTR